LLTRYCDKLLTATFAAQESKAGEEAKEEIWEEEVSD
jgi:hypothetical protein